MHLPLGPFGAAQFRPPPALSPLPRATRTRSKLPTDRQNWNAAFISFDTERNSRICGYGDTLLNPLSAVGFGPRLRGLGSRPVSGARRSRKAGDPSGRPIVSAPRNAAIASGEAGASIRLLPQYRLKFLC